MIVRFLQPADDRSQFSCGDPDYDDFIRKYAGQNEFRHRIGRTLVVVEDERVMAYATFTLGELAVDALPEHAAQGLPRYPAPVLRLARLAVDKACQGNGLGTLLVGEVLKLALRLRDEFCCVAVVVDALRDRQPFYEAIGFERCDVVLGRPRVMGTVLMVLPLADVESALGAQE
ncbi:MAG TPA: GNAT family N-acetyltransferase [Coriobacteriia bacterium]